MYVVEVDVEPGIPIAGNRTAPEIIVQVYCTQTGLKKHELSVRINIHIIIIATSNKVIPLLIALLKPTASAFLLLKYLYVSGKLFFSNFYNI